MRLNEGKIFHGPDEQGYELMHDLAPLMLITVKTFRPFGGAPEPVSGQRLAPWLVDQLYKLKR